MIRTGVLAVPTVSLPLGSESASGAFGNLGVFQGNTVRSLVTPTDPKTAAQLATRGLFYDVTKTLKAAGPWARGVWSGYFGSRWFTEIPKQCTGVANEKWIEAGEVWDAMTELQKVAWAAVAPFQDTVSAKGEVFSKLVRALGYTLPNSYNVWANIGHGGAGAHTAAAAWWLRSQIMNRNGKEIF
jgi:hypothetical protein